MLMTVIGTLSHEFGHYGVARILGYEARINYQSSRHWKDDVDNYLNDMHQKYHEEIMNGKDFPGKEEYKRVEDQYMKDMFLITAGGPFQTMLTGTIGLLLLMFYRNKIVENDKLSIKGWILVFLSLFWLRQLTNLFMAVVKFLMVGKTSIHGDEKVLAYLSGMNLWTIQIITGITSFGVLLWVLKIIPKPQVLTFLLAGLAGGISGYYLWLIKFGPIIMP
jgi:hypothetical protein